MSEYSLETQLVYLGSRPEPGCGAVCPPIVNSSTFALSDIGGEPAYDYSRSGNPTRSALESMLAAAEGARHGIALGSGMAAIDCVFGLLKAGDHVVTGDDIYGGTYRYLVDVAAWRGITFDFVKVQDEATLRSAVRPETRLIWFESPTNPLLNLVDIEMVGRVGRELGVWTALDNTFACSTGQQPLGMGIDVVMHSMTKYLNGHSDVVMGAVMTSDDGAAERMRYVQNAVGAVPSPFDCFLAGRGMKTLGVRMQRHAENAQAVAEFLEGHEKVVGVNYPGLRSHRHHELAKRQMQSFGGMVSFYVRGGLEETRRFLQGTELFTLAVSLGGVESLVCHPVTMTHFEVPQEKREAVGVTENLVRVSVGIESADDLIRDLEGALGRV